MTATSMRISPSEYTSHDLLIWAVAYYAYLGWTRDQIRRKLGCDKATVKRKIDDARRSGILVSAFNAEDAPWDMLELLLLPTSPLGGPRLAHVLKNPSLVAKLTDKSIVTELQERTQAANNLRHVIVCDTGCTRDELSKPDSQRWQERIQLFGRAAAPHVNFMLRHSRVVGVTWGSTLAGVVDELLLQRTMLPKRKGELTCVATVGESIGDDDEADVISASRIARRLKTAVGGQHSKVDQLRGIPALIPFSFQASSAVTAARDGLHGYPNYESVFGKQPNPFGKAGSLSRLDTVLTSVGNMNQANKFFTRELERGGYTNDEVKELKWYGDIGGALFPTSDRVPKRARKVAEQVESRWTGMRLDNYRDLANNKFVATNGKRPRIHECPAGVVVLAIGNNKHDVVCQCLKQDLINTLVIDEDLALALLDRSPRKSPHQE